MPILLSSRYFPSNTVPASISAIAEKTSSVSLDLTIQTEMNALIYRAKATDADLALQQIFSIQHGAREHIGDCREDFVGLFFRRLNYFRFLLPDRLAEIPGILKSSPRLRKHGGAEFEIGALKCQRTG